MHGTKLLTILFSLAAAIQLLAQKPSDLDQYIQEATRRAEETQGSPGSLFSASARLADLARDLRSAQVDDLVTVLVSDHASALAKGTTSSSRTSSASAGITAALGPLRASGPLTDLAGFDSQQQLDGQGQTSRETVLTTTLSARVTHVLPNGYLVIEGAKDVIVNHERQQVSVRGIARWNDVGPGNTVRSDRLANLEIKVQGKGVVGDAIRRPNFLYRLLLGILPI
jgi:flagellar L-ring protein precursor FlgH